VSLFPKTFGLDFRNTRNILSLTLSHTRCTAKAKKRRVPPGRILRFTAPNTKKTTMKKQIAYAHRSTDVVRSILTSIIFAAGVVLSVAALAEDSLAEDRSVSAQNQISNASPVIEPHIGAQETGSGSENALEGPNGSEVTTQVEPFLPTGAPIVATNPATSIANFSARLNGSLNPHGLPTTFHFQYGRSTSYGHTTAPQTRTGNTARTVGANIGGLTAHTTYHFRIVASNNSGTRYGSDRIFTTTTPSTCNVAGTWAGTVSGTWYYGYCSWTGTAFISATITQNGTTISGVADEDGIPCFNRYACGILDFANSTGYVTGSTGNCPHVSATYYGTAISGACSGQSVTAPVSLTLNGNTLIGTSNGFTVILTRQP